MLSFTYLVVLSIVAALVAYSIPFIFLFASLFVQFIFDISFVDPTFNDVVTRLLFVVTIIGIVFIWIITIIAYKSLAKNYKWYVINQWIVICLTGIIISFPFAKDLPREIVRHVQEYQSIDNIHLVNESITKGGWISNVTGDHNTDNYVYHFTIEVDVNSKEPLQQGIDMELGSEDDDTTLAGYSGMSTIIYNLKPGKNFINSTYEISNVLNRNAFFTGEIPIRIRAYSFKNPGGYYYSKSFYIYSALPKWRNVFKQ